MNWFKRKKNEADAPGTQESKEIPLDLENMDLEALDNMANNIMWCRQNLEAMLGYIDFHRLDGHECPPFCFPAGVGLYLEQLPKDHVILMLMVLMKDIHIAYQEPAT